MFANQPGNKAPVTADGVDERSTLGRMEPKMSSEILRIMAEQLSLRWEQLSELDVIEQAETVVRDHYQHLLLDQTAEILSKMESATALLNSLSAAGDSTAAMTAEVRFAPRSGHTVSCG